MAIRMAEGSLFAVLVRSPWWYSALIACVALGLGLVIAGGQFFIFGLALAIPFVGIAGYALFLQSQRPAKKRVYEVTALARKTPYRKIAAKVAASYEKERFDIHQIKSEAADLMLTRGSKTLLLCSKRFKAANVGVEPLKKLVAAGENHEATGYLYVALGEVSAAARDYAYDEDIEVIDAVGLATHWDGKFKLK